MPEALRLLLLSGGSLVGRNLLQSLAFRRSELVLMATNSVAEAPDNFDYDQLWLVPPTAAAGFEARFAAVLAEARPDLIIPCRDDDVLFLARWRESHPAGPECLSGPSALAEMMLDKALTFDFCRQQELPGVPSARLNDGPAVQALVQRFGFPLLLKPRRGFASRDIQLCWSPEALAARPPAEHLIVQPFIGQRERLQAFARQMQQGLSPLFYSFEDQKYSLQLLFGPQSAPLQHFVTVHRMASGHSLDVRPFSDPALDALARCCSALFASHGWRGPLNIQLQRDDAGQYWIHELNGRFTGATSARCLLGLDEVGLTLRAFGWPDMALSAARTGRVQRQISSTWAPAEAVASLKAAAQWRPPAPVSALSADTVQ